MGNRRLKFAPTALEKQGLLEKCFQRTQNRADLWLPRIHTRELLNEELESLQNQKELVALAFYRGIFEKKWFRRMAALRKKERPGFVMNYITSLEFQPRLNQFIQRFINRDVRMLEEIDLKQLKQHYEQRQRDYVR